MAQVRHFRWAAILFSVTLLAVFGLVIPRGVGAAGPPASAADVTFSKDIAPILQRSCQNCHRPDGVAPMSLITYQDVRPWARAMKLRTGLRDKPGTMPPWYIEKNIGIQYYKNDPSLSDEEVAKIAKWADSGARQGNPADMPPPRQFPSGDVWTIDTPDLILDTPDVVVTATQPDWWGELGPSIPTGLTEDRYVSAVEIKEINDMKSGETAGRQTVGGRFVIHHMTYSVGAQGATRVTGAGGPTGFLPHEVGRNADIFADNAGRLMKSGSYINISSVHLHSNGRDTKAHLRFGFKFHPKEYQPALRKLSPSRSLGNGMDFDIRGMEPGQLLHSYSVLQDHTRIVSFEPHLHAPGVRMCLEAIWGMNIQTLSCAGYDHNWVRVYEYETDYQPLLPKGTILHLIGYMDLSPANKNVVDPRNWQGGGNRSVANMFIDIGQGLALTDDEFDQAMAERRAKVGLNQTDVAIGCPLCGLPPREKTLVTGSVLPQ